MYGGFEFAGLIGGVFGLVVLVIIVSVFLSFVPVGLWISAMAAGVKISIFSLVGMRLRRVRPDKIIKPLIKAQKAGMDVNVNGQNNREKSTFWLKNASFLRLKNASVSYTFPKEIISKLKVSQAKLFFMGTNLCLLQDKIRAYDPENSSIMNYPLMRTYSFGINLSF